ncbi:MAG TPA: signal peptide peptidase SppA, partial [Flavisolibacter sp.]
MGSFFKMFFASLLSIIVFCLIIFFFMAAFVAVLTTRDKPDIPKKSVLVIDLDDHFSEAGSKEPFSGFLAGSDHPGLYDVVRLIRHAKKDKDISGIYIRAEGNANGFASSYELRKAIMDFRGTDKFVIAYGNVMSERAYFVASAAEKIYVNPTGIFEWKGLNVTLPFLKGTLEKLDIKAQVFYAGKYKSATEVFRTDKMTPENKLQTLEWLNDIYYYSLMQISATRGIDTASLHRLADTSIIQTPQDAVSNRLIDGAKYDDQVRDEVKKLLKIRKHDKLHFISLSKYDEAVSLRRSGKDRVAVIYAEGNIVDGEGAMDEIGGERFRKLVRRARLDKSVKAIVLRVNSGGGSALASEVIWRELQMAKQDKKPVVVSMGDVAASGGYYIACGADSIFANHNTITGSIGVFGVIPDMSGFFKNKLGITFDGVKTAANADAVPTYRPMNEVEKRMIQAMIERIYVQFKQRVAEGRKRDTAYVENVAQGRV